MTQGFITALHRELDTSSYTVKHADLSDARKELANLATLVVDRAQERTYTVDEGVLKVIY